MSGQVSIHLMLLFIINTTMIYAKVSEFQYISCYSLSLMFKNSNGDNYVSIHLMLLFILIGPQETIPFMPVSIHLMLLFILGQKTTDRTDGCFNTSHVTLYRLSYRNSYQLHLGFNTSHVTLYPSINLV